MSYPLDGFRPIRRELLLVRGRLRELLCQLKVYSETSKSLLELAISKTNFSFRPLVWKHLLFYVEIQNDIFNSKDAKDGFVSFHGHVFTYGDLNCLQATFCNKIINFNTLPRVQKEQKETPVKVEVWAKRFV